MSKIEIKQVGKNLSFSWDNVLDIFTDISVHGLASSWGASPSAGNISSFLKNVRKSVKINEPIENAAFRLVLLCFASAIDELRPVNTKDELLLAARKTVDHVKKVSNEGEYFMSIEFFENPVSLPLYQAIREIFIDALKPLWLDESSVAGKLDRAFNTSLFKVIRSEKNLFEDLISTLNLPTGKIDKLEQDWVSYRARLEHAFEVKPVFGQEDTHISLSQIFVNPRAFWIEKSKTYEGNLEREKFNYNALTLMPDMLEWAKRGDSSRSVRLLRGGPGSGKSSFAKALCAELAKDENVRPIFIELQRLRGEGSLKEKTSKLLVEFDEVFRTDPLNREYLDSNRPLVFVFDGLDELVVPNSKGAQQVAEDVWDDIDDLLNVLNSSETFRAKALITGRDPIIQAARSSRRGRRLNEQDVQRIIGLEPIDKNIYKIGDETDLEDQRQSWWNAYAKAVGVDASLPPIYSVDNLKSLTSEPLLCYLIALSGKAEESRKESTENINDVYEKLIEDVWNRVWGDVQVADKAATPSQKAEIRRLGPVGFFKNQAQFERVLEFVAIAAWRGGESRTATLEEFEKAIRHSEVEDIWRDFQKSFSNKNSEDSFSTLALTFFFRQRDLANRGFEFTHKSFGEYLAARGIARYLKANVSNFASLRSMSGLEEWLKLFGAVTITPEILSFLQNEFLRCSRNDLLDLQQALTRIMKLVVSDGMPIRIGSEDTWRVSEYRQSNAEGTLFAALSAVSRALLAVTPNESLKELFPSHIWRKLFNRLNIETPSSVYKKCLSGLSFRAEDQKHWRSELGRQSGDNFDSMILSGCDLSYSDFSEMSLALGMFVGTNLNKTLFRGTSFASCFMANSNFENCDLKNASFIHTRLNNVRFLQKELVGVDFSNAYLSSCDFAGVEFIDVDFKKADLSSCDFSGANLIKAKNLTVTQLKKAKGSKDTKLPKRIKRPPKWNPNPQ